MAKTHYTLKEKLVQQALAEIAFDVDYRRNKRHSEWKKNEQLMKAYNIADSETKSKVPLFQAISFEETLLSKIDNSLVFKMSPGGLEDKNKAEKFNALRERDAKVDRWDSKDRAGKRHAIRYGRAIYLYTSNGTDGYKPNLSQIRPRHFHIDPDVKISDANGIESALHLGWWGVKKTKWELLQGVKDGLYDKKAVDELILSGSNYSDTYQDDMEERTAGNNAEDVSKNKKMSNKSVWLFYQHFTHDYDTGDRYIMLLTPKGQCIRCEKWKDVDPSGLYPIWTWATSPDDAEFWSIAPLDRVRRIFKAMEKSINQMLDNSDQVNKPKLAVNVDFIRNLAQAKYGTGGFLEITGNVDADKAVKAILTPPIDTPLRVFDKLQMIVDRESGVTAQAAGVSDEDGVLGIYDGNQANLGDRLGLLNKEYSEGYYRFALLWKNGVRNNLTSKVAIRMIGINGIGIEEILWSDLKPTQYDYDILVESTAAETQVSEAKMKQKMEVLTAAKGDEMFNQKAVREKQLDMTGFNEDDKRSLLDTKDGSEGMLVKAYEDFEKLVEGKEVKPPRNASLEYAQAINDLWEEKDELITKMYKSNKAKASMIHDNIARYIEEVQVIVEKNEALKVLQEQANNGNMDTSIPGDPNAPKGGNIDPEQLNNPDSVGQPLEPME
jgi:hypothetical protein